MKKLLLITTFGVLPFLAMPALAATCSTTGVVITCAGSVTGGLTNKNDSLKVTVTTGSSVVNDGGDAIRVRGKGVTVTNHGTISGMDPTGSDGVDGGNKLTVINHGTITATNKGVDADEKNDLRVENYGTIHAYDKAIRNGDGANGYLFNALGALVESDIDEGFESGDNATVINYGTIRASDDAVQVGENATITNYGLIESIRRGNGDETDPQDGIDIDSGTIVNYGTIRSDDDVAIDFDASTITSYITNKAGALISGTTGVLVEKGHFEDGEWQAPNVAAQIISNWGTIEGRNGLALDLGEGDDALYAHAGSLLIGGADFGVGDDFAEFTSPLGLIGGAGALFDGGLGFDILSFVGFSFADLLDVMLKDDILSFSLGGVASILTTGWELFRFDGADYSFEQVAALATPAQVPLPAGVWLIGGGLAAMAGLRRRARS